MLLSNKLSGTVLSAGCWRSEPEARRRVSACRPGKQTWQSRSNAPAPVHSRMQNRYPLLLEMLYIAVGNVY